MVEADNQAHPFAQAQVNDFTVDDRTYKYYSLPALGDERYKKLPYSIRVLLESAVRNCDNFNVKRKYFTSRWSRQSMWLTRAVVYSRWHRDHP